MKTERSIFLAKYAIPPTEVGKLANFRANFFANFFFCFRFANFFFWRIFGLPIFCQFFFSFQKLSIFGFGVYSMQKWKSKFQKSRIFARQFFCQLFFLFRFCQLFFLANFSSPIFLPIFFFFRANFPTSVSPCGFLNYGQVGELPQKFSNDDFFQK